MLKLLRSAFIWCLLLSIYSPAFANETSPQIGAYEFTGTTLGLLGEQVSNNFEKIIPKDEDISWQVYVPETYSADAPAGIIVYISPSNSGEMPKDWMATLKEQNLIWISANQSGNKINPRKRISYTIFSVGMLSNTYEINQDRIYLAGFSGGGRIASIVATEYPHIFKGAIYMSGVNFWNKKASRNIEQIRRNAYVFITGRKDFNFEDTKNVHRRYKKSKVRNLLLNDIPNLKHELPNHEALNQAIKFLDARS